MKLCHISDCHGNLDYELFSLDWDILVCTGDFFPNFRDLETSQKIAAAQKIWLSAYSKKIRKKLGTRKIVWCNGNHDFANLANELPMCSYDATNTLLKIDGTTFFGFPYTHSIDIGVHNYNLLPDDIEEKICAISKDALEANVFLAHAPIKGHLDICSYGKSHGINITPKLDSVMTPPLYYLCGHVHSPGVSHVKFGTKSLTLVNSATTYNIITI